MLKNFQNYFLSLIVIFLLSINYSYAEKVLKIEVIGNDRIPLETIKMLSNINLGDEISSNQINDLIKIFMKLIFLKI